MIATLYNNQSMTIRPGMSVGGLRIKSITMEWADVERIFQAPDFFMGWFTNDLLPRFVPLEVATPARMVAEDELAALLPGTCYMDPPDGGSPSIMEQLRRMADDAAKYRALEAATPAMKYGHIDGVPAQVPYGWELIPEGEVVPQQHAKLIYDSKRGVTEWKICDSPAAPYPAKVYPNPQGLSRSTIAFARVTP